MTAAAEVTAAVGTADWTDCCWMTAAAGVTSAAGLIAAAARPTLGWTGY